MTKPHMSIEIAITVGGERYIVATPDVRRAFGDLDADERRAEWELDNKATTDHPDLAKARRAGTRALIAAQRALGYYDKT